MVKSRDKRIFFQVKYLNFSINMSGLTGGVSGFGGAQPKILRLQSLVFKELKKKSLPLAIKLPSVHIGTLFS